MNHITHHVAKLLDCYASRDSLEAVLAVASEYDLSIEATITYTDCVHRLNAEIDARIKYLYSGKAFPDELL